MRYKDEPLFSFPLSIDAKINAIIKGRKSLNRIVLLNTLHCTQFFDFFDLLQEEDHDSMYGFSSSIYHMSVSKNYIVVQFEDMEGYAEKLQEGANFEDIY